MSEVGDDMSDYRSSLDLPKPWWLGDAYRDALQQAFNQTPVTLSPYRMSDLPKDLPEPERVIPLPDQTEPGDDEDEDQPTLPIPNAQVQGDDAGWAI